MRALAVGLIVAGVRLWLVGRWGGPAPYMDEVSQTGWLHIFAGQQGGGVPWAWVLQPFMEHFLVTQRLFSLGLAALNGGQWDVTVELVASALGWGGLAALLMLWGARGLRGTAVGLWAAWVVMAEAWPHAWENLLWAFQVQFLFLVLGSVLGLWGLVGGRPWGGRWWLGVLGAAVAALSQASGLLVWVVAAAFAGFNAISGRERSWRAVTAGLLEAGVAVALLQAVPKVPHHVEVSQVHSVGQGLRALVQLLGWPWPSGGSVGFAVVLWLPGAGLLLRWWRSREARGPEQWGAALLLWSLLVIVATAFARGQLLVKGPPPARYADMLVIGLSANAWALLQGGGQAPRGARWRLGLVVAWLLVAGAGLVHYTVALHREATPATTVSKLSQAEFQAMQPEHAAAVRAYVSSGDPQVLAVKPPIYPVSEHLAEIIDRLRAVGRWPVVLDPDSKAAVPWLSRLAQALLSGAGWVIALGAGLAIGAAWRPRRLRRAAGDDRAARQSGQGR